MDLIFLIFLFTHFLSKFIIHREGFAPISLFTIHLMINVIKFAWIANSMLSCSLSYFGFTLTILGICHFEGASFRPLCWQLGWSWAGVVWQRRDSSPRLLGLEDAASMRHDWRWREVWQRKKLFPIPPRQKMYQDEERRSRWMPILRYQGSTWYWVRVSVSDGA